MPHRHPTRPRRSTIELLVNAIGALRAAFGEPRTRAQIAAWNQSEIALERASPIAKVTGRNK